ncbi:major histocompatibility complex class I-related gene protein-like [Enoplosus armatus]|uniref:major histocompatibility complex class I-related gene protein-like n=1 Tax=Enoplosus armatus TaxID=215367 RepID=UPI0039921663
MKTLVLLPLLCHVAFPVKHSLKYLLASSYGVRGGPEFLAAAVVDEVQVGYCDSNRPKPEAKGDWLERFPQQLQWYTDRIYHNQQYFKVTIESLMQRFNQTGGVHIFQRVNGCEWDDETNEVKGFNQYGYDGEDFLAFDPRTMTWIAPKQQAVITKHEWDRDRSRNMFWKYAISHECIEFLKEYVDYVKSSLRRPELPSVSLLQKTPSSPVSCHATGFHPKGASLFWRKDGEELHEDVDHGEILPNNDGTFQMSVDLKLSSVTPEDWRRYDCVFQLSGVEDDIVTGLDKAAIRTNWVKPSHMTVPIIAAGVVPLVLFTAAGFVVYKRKKAKCPPPFPDNSEL